MPSAVTKWTHAWTDADAREWLWLTGLVGAFWAVDAVDAIKGVPGHSLALWLPVLVLARARVPRPGSAFLVAGMGGLLVKFPHFHGVALWGFGAAAIVLELLLPGERARDSAWGMLVVDPMVTEVLRPKADTPLSSLQPEHLKVLELIAQGYSDAAIAKELIIDEGQVRSRLAGIVKSLGLQLGDEVDPRVSVVRVYLEQTSGI